MKLILLVLILTTSSFAKSPIEIEEAIRAQMSQRHPNPPQDFWESMGAEAVPVLKNLLTQSSSSYEQSWYIDGLSHFSDPSIGLFLQEYFSKVKNKVTRKKVLAGLIRSQKDAAFDFVEPYLNDSDPHVRLAVAQGMKNEMQSSRATERVALFREREKEGWIKQELERAPPPVRKNGSVVQKQNGLPELPEKEWGGDWKGVWMDPKGSVPGVLTLTREGAQWRARVVIKKKIKSDLKTPQIEVLYSKTDHMHWIEIRNKKDDTRFLGKRTPKKEEQR